MDNFHLKQCGFITLILKSLSMILEVVTMGYYPEISNFQVLRWKWNKNTYVNVIDKKDLLKISDIQEKKMNNSNPLFRFEVTPQK